MYQLLVFYPDSVAARHRSSMPSAADALTEMRALLVAHPGCTRIDLMHDQTPLFSVDCAGNRLSA